MLRLLLPPLLLVVCALEGASAWGPASHASFNCLAYYPSIPLATCLKTKRTLVVASDLPDSFAFGSFNVSGVAAGVDQWGCSGLSYVHDPLFGAHLVRFASANNANYSSGGFEAADFARGFMGHMLGDLVGFNPKGGILDSREAGHPTSAGYLYFPGLSYMAALDSQFLINASMPGTDMPVPGPDTMGAEGQAYRLLHDASVSYSAVEPAFKPVSVSTIHQCVSYWGANMRYVFDRAALYQASSDNADFLVRELSWFAPRAASGTAPTGAQVTRWAMRQQDCSQRAVANYAKLVVGTTTDPKEAFEDTAALVEKLYDEGMCTF